MSTSLQPAVKYTQEIHRGKYKQVYIFKVA